jgi:hypothetical protein
LRLALLFVAALLASHAVHAETYARHLEDFYQAGDGADYAPAIERAELVCAQAQPGIGCTVELGAKVYPLARTANICVPLRIVGQGAGSQLEASRLSVVRTTALRAWNALEACPVPGIAGAHGHLRLEHVTLWSAPVSVLGQPAFYGLEATTRVSLEDVGIRGFVQGIRLVCDVASKHGNCNESTFHDVDIGLSEHAGVYVRGGDSNAHLFSRVRADGNCRHASRWNADAIASMCAKYPSHPVCASTHWQCGGYMDLSFLGNTYEASAAAAEFQPATTEAPAQYYAGYVFAGPGQATTGIGLYAEADTVPQYADSKCTIIGGANSFAGSAGQLHGMATTGLSIVNGKDPANVVRVDLGEAVNVGGAAMAVGSDAVSRSWPWRLKVNPAGQLFWDVANTRFLMALPHLSGNLVVPSSVRVGTSTCSPATGCH